MRYLTNAYGLTPIRRRIIQYLVLPTAAARAFLRAPLEVTGFQLSSCSAKHPTPSPHLQQDNNTFPNFLVLFVQVAAAVEEVAVEVTAVEVAAAEAAAVETVAGGIKRKAEE